MDLTMPVLGGIEATRLIREVIRNSELVIVASTALPCEESRQRALGLENAAPNVASPGVTRSSFDPTIVATAKAH